MLRAIGAASVEELYADIPAHLRMTEPLDIPPAQRSEAELVRHVEGLLSRNTSTREALSFLGAGCYPHHVPAVCDEVGSRAEFLTAYAGEPYEDHGRFQALFEYASMMGELLEMDVVNVPTYDGFQASATALRMAARITGRRSVVVTAAIGPDELSKIRGYLAPDLTVELVPFDARTGEMDLEPLGTAVGERTAAVLVKTPTYLGVVETLVRETRDRAGGRTRRGSVSRARSVLPSARRGG
jgi:glycine dehydrogenase subunit 1